MSSGSDVIFYSTGRSFRTSHIVPYAANLLFVLYDCRRGPRLQLLVNETPLRFPGLPAEDAPLYREVRAAYRHLLDGCDFRRECEGRSEGRAPNTELWPPWPHLHYYLKSLSRAHAVRDQSETDAVKPIQVVQLQMFPWVWIRSGFSSCWTESSGFIDSDKTLES